MQGPIHGKNSSAADGRVISYDKSQQLFSERSNWLDTDKTPDRQYSVEDRDILKILIEYVKNRSRFD